MGKFSQQIRWDITRSVTLASLFYFLYHAGKACLFPFLTLYFRQLGLTATQTGIVTGSKAFVWFLAAPVWTVMGKRFGKTKIILGTAILATIASNLSLTVVSPVDEKSILKNCHSLQYTEVDEEFGVSMPSSSKATSMPTLPSTTLNIDDIVSTTSLLISTAPHKVTSTLKKRPTTESIVDKLKTLSLTSTSTTIASTTTVVATTTKPKTTTKSTTTTTKATTSTTTTPETTTTSSTTTTTPETTTTSSTTTTHVVSLPSSPSEMASYLLPRIMEADPQEPSDIEKLVSRYRETQNWPHWKLRLLTHKIIALLDQQDNEAPLTTTTPIPLTKLNDDHDENMINSLTPNIAHSSADGTLRKIVQELIPDYQKQKIRHPFLTVSEFVERHAQLSVLPKDVKEVIEQYMNDVMAGNEQSHRNKRSISNEGMPLNNATNTSDASSPNMEEGMESSLHLIHEIIPRITSNVFTFVIILVIVVAGEMFSAPIELLSDNSFHELLDELDSLNRYGEHKIAAVIGVMVAGISVSTAVYFSPCYLAGTITRFSLHFYIFAGVVGLAFLVVPFYPMYLERLNQHPRTFTVTLCPSCHVKLCTDCRRILLLLTIILVGIVQAGLQDFLLWEVQNLPGASELVYGSYVSVNAFTALLAVPVGRRMTSSLRATITVPISLLSIAAQLLIYSFIGNAWFILPVQVLNIFGIPFLWMIVGSELKTLMTWQDESTSLRALDQVHVFARSSQKRALYIAYLCTYQGIAFAIGSVISGVCYDASGGTLLPFLRVMASLVAAWAFFYLLFQCFCIKKPKHRRYSKLLDDSEDEVETFNLKDRNANCTLGFPNRKSKYVENGRRVGDSRKKRRAKKFEELTSSSEEDELEREWVSMSARTASNHL